MRGVWLIIEILYNRGEQFIAKKGEIFYLVNLELKRFKKADPPDIPDMFIKLGYFEDAEYSNEQEKEIGEILKDVE